MGSKTVETNYSISTITGYEVIAELRIGSNGDEYGDYEYSVGISPTSFTPARRIWQVEPSQSIDSDLVSIALQLNPGGGSQAVGWTVSGGDTVPLYCSNASYGNISHVKVRAAVQVNGAKMAWTSLVFGFYRNGNLIEEIEHTLVEADTTETSTEVLEQILTVTPAASDNTKVVVAGTAQIVLLGVDIPDPTAIFGQIMVF